MAVAVVEARGVATAGRAVGFGDEGVREGFVRGHAGRGVDGQAALDELPGRERDAAPVFERGEGVVGYEDGLHFFEVGVPVEGRVAAEEEVGYYADGPDVAGGRCLSLGIGRRGWGRVKGGGGLHWLAMAAFLEDLGRHVAWRTARRCQNMEGFLVHYS